MSSIYGSMKCIEQNFEPTTGLFEAKRQGAITKTANPICSTPKQTQIPQALYELSETVDCIDKEFGMLSDKLSPITRCPSPENSVSGGGIPADIPSVELAAIINAATEHLRSIQRSMRSVGERIEL